MFEHLVNAQLVQFLIQNELVPQSQYAKYGRGIVSYLRDNYAKWIENIDKSKYSIVNSFDLKSAYSNIQL